MKPNLIILTGAGISAESGLKTFRDSDGLWEGYDVYEVATPEGWARNPELVQDFYNQRRKTVLEAEPNAAHLALVALEQKYAVTIITQNIDDLHERAGSSNVVHLHGVITKSQSQKDPALVYDIDGWEIKMGDLCELGTQLRPHVVWFGEMVPMIQVAAELAETANIFIIIGTSMQVYPAAGLIGYVGKQAEKIVIDPNVPAISSISKLRIIEKKATIGVPEIVEELLARF